MDTIEAIRMIMKEQGVSVQRLADRLEKKQNVVSERFRQKTITTKKVSETLRALDYKIVIMPRSARIPEGGYEVE